MELSLGTWPEDQPLGRHRSVTHVLPRILGLLDGEGLRGTYFVEGWSAAVYPEVIRRLHDAGHEIGCHGWRHERWSQIASRDLEASLISRAVAEIRGHGVELRGFRPPGGELTECSAELLREQGFAYVSPAARRVAAIGGLVALPFRWRTVDAYYLYDAFAPLRARCGDPEHTLPPDRLVTGVQQVLDEVVSTGGYASLLFHPFLQADGAHFAAMEHIIAAVAKRDDIWCAPCAEHADWVVRHPELLAADPALENVSWQDRAASGRPASSG